MLRSLNWHNIIFDLKIKSEHFIHTANIKALPCSRQYSMRHQPTAQHFAVAELTKMAGFIQ